MRAKVGDHVEGNTLTGTPVKGKVVELKATGYQIDTGMYLPEARLISVNGTRVGSGRDAREERLPTSGKAYMKRWAKEKPEE